MRYLLEIVWKKWELVLTVLVLASLLYLNNYTLFIYTTILPGDVVQTAHLCSDLSPLTCMKVAEVLTGLRVGLASTEFLGSVQNLEVLGYVKLTKVAIQNGTDFMVQVRLEMLFFLTALGRLLRRLPQRAEPVPKKDV